MNILKKLKSINLFSYRKIAGIISLFFIVISLFFISFRGINYGLDFTGGILLTVNVEDEINSDALRDLVQNIVNTTVSVQGSSESGEFLIRLPADLGDNISSVLLSELDSNLDSGVSLISSDFIGAQVGAELRDYGGIGFVVSLIVMGVYLIFRFHYKFAIGAILALFHDVIFILGVLSLFNISFGLTTLAGLLAVIGYSVNDTIVIYDYIREAFRKANPKMEINSFEIISSAVNHTLDRTIITSFLTLLVVVALLLFGGESLFSFSLVLFLGIGIGTFSSIFIASYLVILLNIKRDELVVSDEARRAIEAAP